MNSSNQILVALCVILVLASPQVSHSAVTCGSVLSTMKPCISYLQGTGVSPPGPCCGGVKSLAAAASSKPDKQTACGCLKNASQKLKIVVNRAKTLPQDCGISLSVPISPTIDCSTIN